MSPEVAHIQLTNSRAMLTLKHTINLSKLKISFYYVEMKSLTHVFYTLIVTFVSKTHANSDNKAESHDQQTSASLLTYKQSKNTVFRA